MRSWLMVLLLLALAIPGAAPVARAQACRPEPERTLAAALLAAQPPMIQAERQSAVDATLASCPGAMEQFLSSLMSWDYLVAAHSETGSGAGPTGPASQSAYGGRSWGTYYSAPHGVTLGGTAYKVREILTVSPLLLDLDRDGTADVNGGRWEPHAGIGLAGPLAAFDIDGDGFRDVVEWLGSGDGLLVAPEDPSYVAITLFGLQWVGPRPLNGRDLLGSARGYRGGFEAMLHGLDDDCDGTVFGEEIHDLYVWSDPDGDGVCDLGELRLARELGIERLEPPAPGDCVGAYQTVDLSRASLWDWWPSFFTANKTLPAALPPSSVPLAVIPLADHSYMGPTLQRRDHGAIDAGDAALQAKLNLESARLLAVSPDGNWTVLVDGASDRAEIAAGLACRLWIFGGACLTPTTATPRIVPLPAVNVLQFVFESADRALIVADAGSRLLRLHVPSGTLEELVAASSGTGAFRGSFIALRDGRFVYVDGAFLDPAGYAGPEVLARIDDTLDPPMLIAVGDLDGARERVADRGTLLGELPSSPERQFFVTYAGGVASLMMSETNIGIEAVDDSIAPIGLASSGRKVLYAKKADEIELRVYDPERGSRIWLGRGDYSYPYLVDDGRLAVVTRVDWLADTMHVMLAPVRDTTTFHEVLSCGIGAIRVAEDGSMLACFAPEALYITSTGVTGVAAQGVPRRASLVVHPNPSQSHVAVRLTLPEARQVHVEAFSIDGRRVARLLDASCAAGVREFTWHGVDDDGRRLPPGVYVVRMDDGTRTQECRVSMLR